MIAKADDEIARPIREIEKNSFILKVPEIANLRVPFDVNNFARLYETNHTSQNAAERKATQSTLWNVPAA